MSIKKLQEVAENSPCQVTQEGVSTFSGGVCHLGNDRQQHGGCPKIKKYKNKTINHNMEVCPLVLSLRNQLKRLFLKTDTLLQGL